LPAVPDLPSFTIVTAVLNAAPTIEEALASVRDQEYAGEVEHVVVDGGSTDGTVEILERTPGIRFISEPDEGLSDAMNKGIAMAAGDVIGDLNADDRYEPGAIAAAGRAFAENPGVEWVTGPCRIIDGDGAEIRQSVTAYKNFFLRHYSLPLYLTHNFVSAPSTFARRDALQAIGGFDRRYRVSVDYDVWLKLARRGDPVVLDRYLAAFRMVEGTLSMSGFETQFAEHAEQARRHGNGHALPVAVNQLLSRGIVLVYRAMRARRRFSESRAG
jgi:glycosyltransferase involved in cell wall biosynthesis